MTGTNERPQPRSHLWMRLFLAIQALLAICLLALAATPLTAPATPIPSFAAEVSAEEEEGGEEAESELEEECIEVEEEFCEEGADESGAMSSADKCFLRSAQAHAATRHDKLKVTVGYTTNRPVGATIEIRQGTTHIGTFKRHLGKSGVLRLTSKLARHSGSGVSVRISATERAGCSFRRLVLFPR